MGAGGAKSTGKAEVIRQCRAEHREFLRVLPILQARHLSTLPPRPTESARRAAERRAEVEAILLAGACARQLGRTNG